MVCLCSFKQTYFDSYVKSAISQDMVNPSGMIQYALSALPADQSFFDLLKFFRKLLKIYRFEPPLRLGATFYKNFWIDQFIYSFPNHHKFLFTGEMNFNIEIGDLRSTAFRTIAETSHTVNTKGKIPLSVLKLHHMEVKLLRTLIMMIL